MPHSTHTVWGHVQWLSFMSIQWQTLGCPEPFAELPQALTTGGSRSWLPAWYPIFLQVQHRQVPTTNCFVALGQSLAATDTGLQHSPWKEASELTPGGWLQTTRETSQIASEHPKGDLRSYQSLLGQILLNGVSPCQAVYRLWLWPVLTASQPEGKSHPLPCHQQSKNRQKIQKKSWMQWKPTVDQIQSLKH